jgi:hypothetical protein
VLFPESGVAVIAAGGKQVIFDSGPLGPGGGGHSHADALSLIARDGADETLIDSGTFTYVADPQLRDWFRSTAAHNTVRIDERDQAAPEGPFRWATKPEVRLRAWSSHPAHDFVDAQCRPADADTTHRRRLLFLKSDSIADLSEDCLVVCDSFERSGRDRHIEQFWYPGEHTEILGPGHLLIGRRGHLIIPEPSTFEAKHVWRSQVFGGKRQTIGFVVHRTPNEPPLMWTILWFGERSTRATIKPVADAASAVLNLGEIQILVSLEGDDATFAISRQ